VNAPAIEVAQAAEAGYPVKARLDDVLRATRRGLAAWPSPTEEQRRQAAEDIAVIDQALEEILTAPTEHDADLAFVIVTGKLAGRGCRRGIALGQFAPAGGAR
jgi:hypothetical protein